MAAATRGDDSPNGPGTVCSYVIAPATHAIGADGGSGDGHGHHCPSGALAAWAVG